MAQAMSNLFCQVPCLGFRDASLWVCSIGVEGRIFTGGAFLMFYNALAVSKLTMRIPYQREV
jgi:hypothetical protein